MTTIDRTALALMLVIAFAMCATRQHRQMPEFGICPSGWARECLCVERGRVEIPSEEKDVEALVEMITPGDALEICMDMWPPSEPETAGVRE